MCTICTWLNQACRLKRARARGSYMLRFGDSYTTRFVGGRSHNTSDKWEGQILGHRQGSPHGNASTEWSCNFLADHSYPKIYRPYGSFDDLEREIAWRRRDVCGTTTTLGQVAQDHGVFCALDHGTDVRICLISPGRTIVEPPQIPRRESESCSSCATHKKGNANARC